MILFLCVIIVIVVWISHSIRVKYEIVSALGCERAVMKSVALFSVFEDHRTRLRIGG